MRRFQLSAPALAAGVALAVLAGFGLARLTFHPAKAPETAAPTGQTERKPLYWYDPMTPGAHFDKPGKSPFMEMQLVPKYAEEGGGATPGVQVDPRVAENLGLRTAVARTGDLGSNLAVTGALEFNQRDIANIEPRTNGFVQRVYARAPGDVIGAGAPIVDLLVPDWGGAQAEFLALVRTGDPSLIAAGRRRLELMGMPPSLISRVEKSGRPANEVTITSPISGSIQKLDVRPGMSVSAGQSLAVVNGLGTVWLDAAIPEAQSAGIHVGQAVSAVLAAYPGETFAGRVTDIVPQAQTESHTVQVRIELANRQDKLHPGLYATVRFASTAKPALLVPTEAVIRTGRRDLVMLAIEGGHYQPAEVRLGREANGQTEILAGLAEGERVVTSGQFLLDSEASLSGLQVRPISAAPTGGVAGVGASTGEGR
jgi:Cu(I)/Ag(I) efflux system membrane fusion protein